MSMESLLVILLIGGIAGWLAGMVVKGYGFGLLGNIVVGIVGAFVGTWLFGRLGISISSGMLGAIIKAMIGAIVVLVVVGVIRRA